MKKTFFTIVMGVSSFFLQAQQVSTFEDVIIPADSFLDGSQGDTQFVSGSAVFPVLWNTQYLYWESGWAISNKNDSTIGPNGVYYSRAGKGQNESVTYALGKDQSQVYLKPQSSEDRLDGMYITNNTYAYSSMKDGDAFAKKFGGVSGNDPDFFLLTVKAWKNGTLVADTVNFYLADFRNADNSKDYIVNSWTWVDLSSLNGAAGVVPDSLIFYLTSTDNSNGFMNTPGFFCMDDLTIDFANKLKQAKTSPFSVFPNPSKGDVFISGLTEFKSYKILNIKGQEVLTGLQGENKISLQGLENGIYFLQLYSEGQIYHHKVIKN